MATESKFCGGCQVKKPRAEFSERAGAKDGLRPRCKACVRAYSREHYEQNKAKRSAQAAAWYAANRDRKRETQRRWIQDNPEWAAEYRAIRAERDPGERRRLVRAWRERNPERSLEQSRAWRAANCDRLRELGRAQYAADPTKFIERAARRRALTAGSEVGPVDLGALWDGLCGICGDELDPEAKYPDPLSKSIDHVMPLAAGGTHTQDNLQWAHLFCNVSKGARELCDDMRRGAA